MHSRWGIPVEENSLSLLISLDSVFLNVVVVGFENNFKLTKKLQENNTKSTSIPFTQIYLWLTFYLICLYLLPPSLYAFCIVLSILNCIHRDPLTQYHFSKYVTVYFLRIVSFISIVHSSTLINLTLVQ